MELVDRLRQRFLVRQFQQGNADAFFKLVQQYERRLLYYLRRFERDPARAHDALQEVWLSAWSKRRSLRSPDAFRSWLYRIAHGKIVEAIREETRRRQTEQERKNEIAPSGSIAPTQEIAELIHFALLQISPEHREVLTLRFIEEMTIKEIAEAIDCPVGTVKSRLHYASREIQTVIEEQENGCK